MPRVSVSSPVAAWRFSLQLEFEKFGGSVVAAGGRVTADFDEQVYLADTTIADRLLAVILARLAPA